MYQPNRLPTLLLGLCLGSAGLWLAFRGTDLGALLRTLRNVDPGLTAAALLTAILTLFVSTARWQILFYPEHRLRSFTALFRANTVGQMLNIVSPVRVGEIARMYTVADVERLDKAQVLATLAIEKVLDLATFALAVLLLSATVALPPAIRLEQRTLWVGGIVGALLLWWIARHPASLEAISRRFVGALPRAWRRPASDAVRSFVDGLTALRSSRAWLAAVGLSIALVVVAAWTNYLLFLAFGLRLPPLAALLLLVVLQVGAVPPSLPGKVGIFNYLTVVTLALFAIDRTTAAGYSILLYAVALAPKIVLGAAFLATGASPAREAAAGAGAKSA